MRKKRKPTQKKMSPGSSWTHSWIFWAVLAASVIIGLVLLVAIVAYFRRKSSAIAPKWEQELKIAQNYLDQNEELGAQAQICMLSTKLQHTTEGVSEALFKRLTQLKRKFLQTFPQNQLEC